jgi:hypothetical protein
MNQKARGLKLHRDPHGQIPTSVQRMSGWILSQASSTCLAKRKLCPPSQQSMGFLTSQQSVSRRMCQSGATVPRGWMIDRGYPILWITRGHCRNQYLTPNMTQPSLPAWLQVPPLLWQRFHAMNGRGAWGGSQRTGPRGGRRDYCLWTRKHSTKTRSR